LRNVKNKNIVEKRLKVCSDDSQVMTSYQENTTKLWTKQPIECWMLTTDRATTQVWR